MRNKLVFCKAVACLPNLDDPARRAKRWRSCNDKRYCFRQNASYVLIDGNIGATLIQSAATASGQYPTALLELCCGTSPYTLSRVWDALEGCPRRGVPVSRAGP